MRIHTSSLEEALLMPATDLSDATRAKMPYFGD